MKLWLALFAAAFCAAGKAGAVDGPFMPIPNTVDHVVTTVGTGTHPQIAGYVRTITHRGDWTRIDGASPNGSETSVTYVGHAASVSVRVSPREASGGTGRTLRMQRGPQRDPGDGSQHDAPRRTGERRTVLGESCEIWNAASLASSNWLSCVTDDGIELASYWLGRDGAEEPIRVATKLERRPVRLEEAQPPAGLLDLAAWLGTTDLHATSSAAAAEAVDDHEVVLSGRGPRHGNATRTSRRHGPWTYTETVYGDRRRTLEVRNRATGFRLGFDDRAPTGETLTMSMDEGLRDDGLPGRGIEAPTGPSSTILGENCTVVASRPDLMDAGWSKCIGRGGVVLRESRWGRSSGLVVFEAVRLQRGPVEPAKALPPGEILSPERWGLPR